jgi:hypothetical protein
MFDILAHTDISVREFDLHILKSRQVSVEIYTKYGTYVDSVDKPSDWTLICNSIVRGKGKRHETRLSPAQTIPIDVLRGHTQAFYITLRSDNLGIDQVDSMTWNQADNTPVSQNSDLSMYAGVSTVYYFWKTEYPRVWDGNIHYTYGLSGLDWNGFGLHPDDKPYNIKRAKFKKMTDTPKRRLLRSERASAKEEV